MLAAAMKALVEKFYIHCKSCVKRSEMPGLVDVELGVEELREGRVKPVLKVKCQNCGEYAEV